MNLLNLQKKRLFRKTALVNTIEVNWVQMKNTECKENEKFLINIIY